MNIFSNLDANHENIPSWLVAHQQPGPPINKLYLAIWHTKQNGFHHKTP